MPRGVSPSGTRLRSGCSSCLAATTGSPRACPTAPTTRSRTCCASARIDLSRPDRFRGSRDLEEFATAIGRYDPGSGPFDVAWAYGDRGRLQSPYNTNRLWGVVDRFSPSLGLSTSMPYVERPVFVVPDRPLVRQDFMAICREHYEGTVLDQTAGYSLMSPHSQTDRPICYSTTDYGVVWQLRRSLPEAVGNVMWLALSRPCSSAFVPFYAGVRDVPQSWSQKKAYLAFRAVADSLDLPGTVAGETRYRHYTPIVRGAYGDFEARSADAQPGRRGDGRRSLVLVTGRGERVPDRLQRCQGQRGRRPGAWARREDAVTADVAAAEAVAADSVTALGAGADAVSGRPGGRPVTLFNRGRAAGPALPPL